LIKTNFSALVRTNSVFWNAGGVNVNLHFFGIEISEENFRSLVIGGIAFATPDDAGPPAPTDEVFPLHEKLDDKWLQWSPSITITNVNSALPANNSIAPILNNLNQPK
jgi:paraquat-inducible protein B